MKNRIAGVEGALHSVHRKCHAHLVNELKRTCIMCADKEVELFASAGSGGKPVFISMVSSRLKVVAWQTG